MSMKKNLALIYLALVWSREALTLGDLLRYLAVYGDLWLEVAMETVGVGLQAGDRGSRAVRQRLRAAS